MIGVSGVGTNWGFREVHVIEALRVSNNHRGFRGEYTIFGF